MLELVVQRTDFPNVTDWDGQRWLEILPAVRLSERSGLYHDCAFLPRNKRQVFPEPSWLRIILTSRKGKSLEQMAILFGDDVDAKKVLEEHLDHKEDHFAKA